MTLTLYLSEASFVTLTLLFMVVVVVGYMTVRDVRRVKEEEGARHG